MVNGGSNAVTNGVLQYVEDADSAYGVTLNDVMHQGHEVQAGKTLSTGSGKVSKEILYYLLVISNPRQRLVWNPARRINLPGAIARFVWMMGANNRLKDIEFYWGKRVASFSDDGIIVPGSDYGARMLNPRPGVNQLDGVIRRLREDPSTRRATIPIFAPEDSIRDSRDIPCAFGVAFHIRDDVLHASIHMRSNNAFILMPFNIFEFSLLAEAVAAELKVPFGSLSYSAWSMHIYGENYENAQQVINAMGEARPLEIPPIPYEPSPMAQIVELVKLEANARHGAAGFSNTNFSSWIEDGNKKLNPYWSQFYFLLLLHMAQKNNLQGALDQLNDLIISPWRDYLLEGAFTATPTTVPLGEEQNMFGGSGVTTSLEDSLSYQRQSSLEKLCIDKSSELKMQLKSPISFEEFLLLRNSLVDDRVRSLELAARDQSNEIKLEDFEEAFKSIRIE